MREKQGVVENYRSCRRTVIFLNALRNIVTSIYSEAAATQKYAEKLMILGQLFCKKGENHILIFHA